jgi:hypothetical protein
LRAGVHQHDEQRAEEEEPSCAGGLLDEQVLPDEGGEVDRRNERDRTPDAVDQRQPE